MDPDGDDEDEEEVNDNEQQNDDDDDGSDDDDEADAAAESEQFEADIMKQLGLFAWFSDRHIKCVPERKMVSFICRFKFIVTKWLMA